MPVLMRAYTYYTVFCLACCWLYAEEDAHFMKLAATMQYLKEMLGFHQVASSRLI